MLRARIDDNHRETARIEIINKNHMNTDGESVHSYNIYSGGYLQEFGTATHKRSDGALVLLRKVLEQATGSEE